MPIDSLSPSILDLSPSFVSQCPQSVSPDPRASPGRGPDPPPSLLTPSPDPERRVGEPPVNPQSPPPRDSDPIFELLRIGWIPLCGLLGLSLVSRILFSLWRAALLIAGFYMALLNAGLIVDQVTTLVDVLLGQLPVSSAKEEVLSSQDLEDGRKRRPAPLSVELGRFHGDRRTQERYNTPTPAPLISRKRQSDEDWPATPSPPGSVDGVSLTTPLKVAELRQTPPPPCFHETLSVFGEPPVTTNEAVILQRGSGRQEQLQKDFEISFIQSLRRREDGSHRRRKNVDAEASGVSVAIAEIKKQLEVQILKICWMLSTLDQQDAILRRTLSLLGLNYVVEHPLSLFLDKAREDDSHTLCLTDRCWPPHLAAFPHVVAMLRRRRTLEKFVTFDVGYSGGLGPRFTTAKEKRLLALRKCAMWARAGGAIEADLGVTKGWPTLVNLKNFKKIICTERRAGQCLTDGEVLHNILFTWLTEEMPEAQSDFLTRDYLSLPSISQSDDGDSSVTIRKEGRADGSSFGYEVRSSSATPPHLTFEWRNVDTMIEGVAFFLFCAKRLRPELFEGASGILPPREKDKMETLRL